MYACAKEEGNHEIYDVQEGESRRKRGMGKKIIFCIRNIWLSPNRGVKLDFLRDIEKVIKGNICSKLCIISSSQSTTI